MTHGSSTSRRTPSATSTRAGRNLPAAVATGVSLALLVVVSLAFPALNWLFVALVAVALSCSVIEVDRALQIGGMHASRVPLLIGTVAAVVVPYGLRIGKTMGFDPGVHPTGIVFGIVGFTAVLCLATRMVSGAPNFTKDAAASLFILVYVPLLGSFVSLMLAGEHGGARVTAFILSVAGSDTGGFIAGVLFGKHQMAPVISPKKTWEGLAGSILLTSATATAFAVWVFHVDWWVGLVMGLVVTAAAVVGDLIESMIKRDVGIKDMSSFLPGHGGFMDRLDSLLVAAPFAWLCMFLMVPGG